MVALQSRAYEAGWAFGLRFCLEKVYNQNCFDIVDVNLIMVNFTALFKAVSDVVMGNSQPASSAESFAAHAQQFEQLLLLHLGFVVEVGGCMLHFAQVWVCICVSLCYCQGFITSLATDFDLKCNLNICSGYVHVSGCSHLQASPPLKVIFSPPSFFINITSNSATANFYTGNALVTHALTHRKARAGVELK